MSESIFRQKSLDRINSPEDLNDYVRVSNPGVWLLLISVIALFIGACVWGIFGHIDTTMSASVMVSDGNPVCYVSVTDAEKISVGMTVRFNDIEATIVKIDPPVNSACACTLQTGAVPIDGVYTAEIVLETIKPISFILN